MSYVQRIDLDITTGTDGSATGTSVVNVNGLVHTVTYTTTTAGITAATSTLTVASKLTGQTIIDEVTASASFAYRPRQLTHTSTGGVVTYATSANANNVAMFAVADEVLTYTVANGGVTKSVSITFLIV